MQRILNIIILLSLFCFLPFNAHSQATKKKKITPMVSPPKEVVLRPQAEQLAIDALYLDALKQSTIGNTEAALDLYFKLIEMDPNHAVAYYEIARLQVAKNKYRNAIVFAEKAVQILPENQYYKVLLADIYQLNGLYDKASEIYADLAKQYPSNMEYTYEWANSYIYQGNIKKAITVYDLLEKRVGINDETSMLKYNMYKSTGDLKSAIGEIEKLSNQYPREIKYLEILAEDAMNRKDYKKALVYYQKILQVNPEDPYVNISLSDYYRKIEDYPQAFAYLAKGIENPNLDFQTKWNVLSVYAQYLNLSKDLKQQAEELFKLMLKAHPKEVTAHHLYGRFLLRQDRYKEAADVFSYSLSLDSSIYPVWETLLLAYHVLGDTSQLLDVSRRAAQLFPEQALLYFYPALIYYQQEQYDSVISLAEKTLKLNQKANLAIETETLSLLADAYYQTRNYEKSFQTFGRLLLLDSENKYVINNYAYYLSLQKTDLDEAEKMIRELCKKEPDNPTFLDTFAWVLFQKGEYKEAETLLKRAMQNGGWSDAAVLEHYGDVLFKIGRLDAALEYWQKAKAQQEDVEPILEQKIETKTWMENPL